MKGLIPFIMGLIIAFLLTFSFFQWREMDLMDKIIRNQHEQIWGCVDELQKLNFTIENKYCELQNNGSCEGLFLKSNGSFIKLK